MGILNFLKIAYTYDRYEKVAAFLYDKSTEGSVITYTHEEISTCVGLSRVVVTKVLKEMEEAGLIKNLYRKVKVINREKLEEKYLKC